MQTKTTRLAVTVKDADSGLVEAVFSTYDVVDSDGDVTRPGAFDTGAPVLISAWNHTSWGSALPVGKGVIRDDGDKAVLEGRFFLNTDRGREHFEIVREIGELQEWSYGYEPLEYSFGEVDGRRVRFLEKLAVTEVSPVLKGAGVDTRTLVVKSASGPIEIEIDVPVPDADKLAAALTAALKGAPEGSGSVDPQDEKRRNTDLLRLVAAAHGIPTGGTS